MGTQSLTIFREEDNSEIAVLYKQFDGYLSGHGRSLKEILDGMILVNGYSGDEGKAANGMQCLACQVIAELKDLQRRNRADADEAKRMKDGATQVIGGFYLMPAGTSDVGEEFTYIIKPGPQQRRKFGDAKWEKEFWPVHITVKNGDNELYSGPVDGFNPAELEAKTNA